MNIVNQMLALGLLKSSQDVSLASYTIWLQVLTRLLNDGRKTVTEEDSRTTKMDYKNKTNVDDL